MVGCVGSQLKPSELYILHTTFLALKKACQICQVLTTHLPQQVILPTSTQCDNLLYRAKGPTILNSQIP